MYGTYIAKTHLQIAKETVVQCNSICTTLVFLIMLEWIKHFGSYCLGQYYADVMDNVFMMR